MNWATVSGENRSVRCSRSGRPMKQDVTALPPIIGCKVWSQKPCSVPSSLKFNWFTLPQ